MSVKNKQNSSVNFLVRAEFLTANVSGRRVFGQTNFVSIKLKPTFIIPKCKSAENMLLDI